MTDETNEFDETAEGDIEESVKKVKRAARKKSTKNLSDEELAKERSTWENVVSTGSTLLDLAISGGAKRGGGIPGGFIVEISGGESSGKTTIACGTVASAQAKGGECKILDPECRLTPEYCYTMGVKFNEEDYYNPETVEEVFDYFVGPLVKKGNKVVRDFSEAWSPDPSKINVCMVDSIAALAGEMELNQGDAMGGNRPKQFSQGLRLSKTVFRKNNAILFLTNQLRDNMSGYGKKKITGTGNAVKFYSTIRIELGTITKLVKEIDVRGRKQKKTFGQTCDATIIKNSLDDPFRTVPIYLTYGYGIDDIRANLQYLKDNGGFDTEDENGKLKKATQYLVGGIGYNSIQDAIKAVEDNNLENEIKEQTITLWEEIEGAFKIDRKRRTN